MSRQPIILALVLSLALLSVAGGKGLTDSSTVRGTDHEHRLAVADNASDSDEVSRRFLADLEALIAKSIVPGIRRGVLAKSIARPPALRVEVTGDPSPYRVRASADSDGMLRVQLSLGYVTMHDAALDAVVLSAVLHRPEQLRSYLSYQLALARENERREVEGVRRHRALSFAMFARLDPKATETLYAQDSFRRERVRIEANSLGWVVAYLLVKEDPRLAGELPSTLVRDGRAAAKLAAASGWFPVPPIATALGLAEVAPPAQGAGLSPLCGAARLMEEGVQILKVSQPWVSRLKRDPAFQRQIAAIESDVLRMRHDGDCASAMAAAL